MDGTFVSGGHVRFRILGSDLPSALGRISDTLNRLGKVTRVHLEGGRLFVNITLNDGNVSSAAKILREMGGIDHVEIV